MNEAQETITKLSLGTLGGFLGVLLVYVPGLVTSELFLVAATVTSGILWACKNIMTGTALFATVVTLCFSADASIVATIFNIALASIITGILCAWAQPSLSLGKLICFDAMLVLCAQIAFQHTSQMWTMGMASALVIIPFWMYLWEGGKERTKKFSFLLSRNPMTMNDDVTRP